MQSIASFFPPGSRMPTSGDMETRGQTPVGGDVRGDVVSGYRAILFLDLVGSCDWKARLGEQRFFEEIESQYLDIVRRVLEAIPCRERNDTGDGKLLTFDRVEDAVHAALLIQACLRTARWSGERPQVRIGLHGGSTRILPGGEIRGNNVDLCARVNSLALPGQILLTRHAYDEARRFVRSHPLLEGQTERPELVWRIHGAYPFKGFAEQCEVCEIGAEGEAPLEPPAMPSAAGATDKAFKIVENLSRFVRRKPLTSIGGAVALVAVVAITIYSVLKATQQLPSGTAIPGSAVAASKLLERERFRDNDDETWFKQIVGRHEDDKEAYHRRPNLADVRDKDDYVHVAVFISDPLPYSQRSLEFTCDRYEGLADVYVTALVVRENGWSKPLTSKDYVVSNGRITFRVADVQRGSELRIIVFAVANGLPNGEKLPKPTGLVFKVP